MSWTLTNSKTGGSTISSVAVPAFTNPLTNPSLIIVGVYTQSVSTVPNAPTDTAGNTYIDAGPGNVHLSNGVIRLFYALNTHTTASNIISITGLGTSSNEVIAAEFTGGVTSSPVDAFASNANASATSGSDNATSTALTTTINGDLIIGLIGSNFAGSVGTGFTQISTFAYLSYLVQSTHGSISATWNASNGSPYGAIGVSFLVGAGGGGTMLPVGATYEWLGGEEQ